MENRGQKRTESADELPADKRTCTSLEFRPSSSHSTPESHENDTEASSSVSASSSHSEGEPDCDSDDAEQPIHNTSVADYYRRRVSGDQGKLKTVLRSLNEQTDPSELLISLTELCEVLSFCTENSLSGSMADSLSPVLVRLAGNESNPDIMLLAVRAITYLCDVLPQSSCLLIRHGAANSLCQILMAIQYLDVAEQCLQAFEKISKDQPLPCLQAGAIMAVLSYIDFFSTSIQRVALSTVVNICKKLPSEGQSPFMDAVPTLCNLLQYEDRQLVESAASCLIKIVEKISKFPEKLDEICKHGIINGFIHLLNSNSRITLSEPTYSGLIGLLVKLSSGSVEAFKTLYELDISSLLKDILSNYDLSHAMTPSHNANGQCNQVHEVLTLLNELLPASTGDQCSMTVIDKAYFLDSHPDLLQKFGIDILPLLVEMVNSGANVYVCYGCLSIVKKLVYLSKSGVLLELLKSANIPSFLAGVFTRKDHHVIMLALEITEMTLQKTSDFVLNSFIKEGVYFAIDALLTPEKCSQSMFPVFSAVSDDPSQKLFSKEVLRCLCFAFEPNPSPSEAGACICKLEKDSVQNIAKQIRTICFSSELLDSSRGLTDVLQTLKCFSSALNDLRSTSINCEISVDHEEKLYNILHQIMDKLNGREPVSTFEFIESGLVRSLVNYLTVDFSQSQFSLVEKKFEVFSRLFSPSSDLVAKDLPLLPFIRKLQSALSSLEDFPVISSQITKQRNSYATVPNGRPTQHPCLKVCFVKGDGETNLCNYSEDIASVDPLASLDAIEEFLRRKLTRKRNVPMESSSESEDHMMSQDSQHTSSGNSSQDENSGHVDHDSVASALSEMQVMPIRASTCLKEINLSKSVSDQVDNSGQPDSVEKPSSEEAHVVSRSFLRSMEQINLGFCHMNSDELFSRAADVLPHTKVYFLNWFELRLGMRDLLMDSVKPLVTNMKTECNASCGDESAKLLLFLEGEQVDYSLTLYQAIIQQRIKAQHEIASSRNIWSQTYTIMYKRAVKTTPDIQTPAQTEKFGTPSFLRCMFTCDLSSDPDLSNPTYDILFMLKSMEMMNRSTFQLMSSEKIRCFAEGRVHDLDNLRVKAYSLPQSEFLSSKLNEKLEQQMRDSLAVSSSGMPSWCSHLVSSYPFLFSFEVRRKYFRQEAFGRNQNQVQNLDSPTNRRQSGGALARKKFLVSRERILESAAQMMNKYAGHKVVLEVEYGEEVGTGLGPTLEFYTLVSHEFQKYDLGMWREDHCLSATVKNSQVQDFGMLMCSSGLFPRPWASTENIQFTEVLNKFVLLGKVVAKAIEDGRVLDLPFSKAFYKLMLGQELSLFDIPSFDPELGRTLVEFQALVNRKKHLDSMSGGNSRVELGTCFRDTKIEEMYIDFTLPGYPDFNLSTDETMVNESNLEDYVSLVVDATTHAGISRQVEAFKSGFNKVFPIRHLQIFTEEELERLLCGERDSWAYNELLDHIKFDHGYTASSPPIVNLLEIALEFNYEQRRAFLQFVTGAPRLPPGGLASLNPKLTIVRKHCSGCVDADLPSVMTCANYLKLPPYSSKERMKEKLLYAITEGQGSFHLS
ncbi:hypothetical protein ACFE04_020318 [Oxalis oulophora]